MPSCCVPETEYRRFFRTSVARRDARRFRKRGLDGVSRRMADAVRERGVEGATVLEAGGGVGALEIALLEAGAASATNVELSPSYEAEAGALLRERGLEARVERRLGDFVTTEVPAADVVLLNRVVCCYPDAPRLMDAAALRASRLLVVSFPREAALTRLGARTLNAYLRLRRCGFQTYVHPIAEILAAAEARGLRPAAVRGSGPLWRVAVLERV